MKKKILLALALLLTMFLPRLVSAAPTASNWEIYCGDINKTVSKDTPVYCYLIAKITNEGNVGIYGALTGVELNDKLELVTGAQAGALDPNVVTVTPYNYEQTSIVSSKKCEQRSGCFDFLATSPQAGIPSKGGQNSGSTEGVEEINSKFSAYTILGWYQVKLREEATTDQCGEICVYIFPVMTATEITGQSYSSVGTPDLSNGMCKEIKPTVIITPTEPGTCYTSGEGENIKYYGKDGSEVSKEQYDKDCGNPTTGGWASYAVLAAGAFIALSAITIAKKHNKFYQV